MPHTNFIRRQVLALIGLTLALGFSSMASAADLSSISNQDAASGIKGALDQGAASAVATLGVAGGFLNNPKVKIPLPSVIEKGQSVLRMMGRG